MPTFVVSSTHLNAFDQQHNNYNSNNNPSIVFNANTMTSTSSQSGVSSTSTAATSATTRTATTTTTTTTPKPSTTASTTTTRVIPSTSEESSLSHPCPGICVNARYARYCGNILSNGRCDREEEECCLQSDLDIIGNASKTVTHVEHSGTHVDHSGTLEKSGLPNTTDTESNNSNVEDDSDHFLFPSSSTTVAPTPYPLCEGTCVAPLFNLLCDDIDYERFCPNGGSCCVTREPTTTTPAPGPGPCPGTCIPIVLSGVCNRPSELIRKTTDCKSGSICCHTPNDKDDESNFENNKDDQEEPPFEQSPPPHMPPQLLPQMPPSISEFLFPNKPPGSQEPLAPPPMLMHRPAYGVPGFHANPIGKPPLSPPQTAPQPPQHSIPPAKPPSDVTSLSSEEPQSQSENGPPIAQIPGGPAFCPGPCIAPMLRFTCFGGNVIYPKFQCAKPGQICCASMADIQSFEANVLANNGIWRPPQKPIVTTVNTNETMIGSAAVKRKYNNLYTLYIHLYK